MSRRAFLQGMCGCGAALWTGGIFARGLDAKLAPGFRPEAASDENGLWDQFAREEEKLKRSRFLIRDPELNAYVHAIACRVAGDYCKDLRVYLVRTPYFNAFMAPNGLMTIWSGTLLRCQSEAQLAAVIGHEAGHYLRRHGVDRFRDAQEKSSLSLLVTMGMAATGVGHLASAASGVLLAATAAFTRDQEREADTMGMELCARAGYDPEEAANVWAHLIAERSAREEAGFRDLIFATHPVEEERESTLRELAKDLEGRGAPERRGRDRYLNALRSERAAYFADEVQLRNYGPSIALFERMLAEEKDDLQIAFNLGEVYRMRARDGDDVLALGHFESVVSGKGGPPEAWRSMGLVRRARGEKAEAVAAFQRYLDARPNADDAAIVKSYLNEGRIS